MLETYIAQLDAARPNSNAGKLLGQLELTLKRSLNDVITRVVGLLRTPTFLYFREAVGQDT